MLVVYMCGGDMCGARVETECQLLPSRHQQSCHTAAGATHLPAPQMDLQYPRLLCAPLRHPHIRLLDIRCHYKKLYLIDDTLLKVKIVHLSSVFTASAQLQDNSEYLFVCWQTPHHVQSDCNTPFLF